MDAVLREIRSFHGVELRFAPPDGEKEVQSWLMDGWSASPQSDGDLGAKLAHAFGDAFAAGSQRVVIIGSDCPYLTAEDILTAWKQLRRSDLVLGPAMDGGYWLIGLRAAQPDLFAGISWSTDEVLNQTLARAKALGLSTVLLRTLNDVDTREDWERFISAAAQTRTQYQSPAAD